MRSTQGSEAMAPGRPASGESAALLPQRPQGRYKPWFGRVNHNVALTMMAKAGDGLSAGLWNGAVMATFLYLSEKNSNKVRPLLTPGAPSEVADRPHPEGGH